ncbi:MAG: TonB family protein [Gemmatimonadetes bacterium]|nr:TonB family protein [Gemmatimonadota bacterium]
MMAAWMVYAMVISALIGLAAVAGERTLRLAGHPARWAWGAAIVASVAVPLMALLRPAGSTGGAIPLDAPSTLIDPALLLGLLGTPANSPTFSALTGVVVGAWVGASVLLAIVLVASQLRIRREAGDCPGEVVDGVLVRFTQRLGPAVVGSFPSIIVLPAWVQRLAADRRRLVLSHELEHIHAGDLKLLSAGLLIAVLVPWNIPLWWQLRRLRDAVELDCDDRVLKSWADPGSDPRSKVDPRSRVDPRVYGELLLEVARHRSAPIFPAPALSNPKSLLARRIHKMMHPNPKARTVRAGVAAAAATVLVALACDTPAPVAVEFDSELGTATGMSDVYLEGAVEVRPERISGPFPRYPEMLRQAGIEGRVLLEFVIKQDGTVDSSSLSVLESTNRAFEGPARAVIEGSLYTPGEVDGGPVRVLVSQQIGFTLAAKVAQKAALQRIRVRQLGSAASLLRIRGDGRLGSPEQPLVVIDGVIIGGDAKAILEELDIVSIEVIKGAAAVALYGERGADGVIQIFTKNAINITGRKPAGERN